MYVEDNCKSVIAKRKEIDRAQEINIVTLYSTVAIISRRSSKHINIRDSFASASTHERKIIQQMA